MTAFTCPVCAGDLRESSRHGILIDTCTRCRGVWLDRGELEKLSTAMGAGEERKGFLQGTLDSLGHRTHRRRDDDDDDADGYRSDKRSRKRKSLLDFFD